MPLDLVNLDKKNTDVQYSLNKFFLVYFKIAQTMP